MWSHRPSFAITLRCASRIVQLRDHLFGKIPSRQQETPGLFVARHTIPSGNNLLDAIYVEPTAQPAQASVLICHGIGEIAPHWFPIQRILADSGVASLVFDYSGYGRSTGHPDWDQLELDAIAAFHHLASLTPSVPVSLLGFSLGTGVIPAILGRVQPHRLVLCAGFTSFRAAARAIGIPAFLAPFVPPIWNAQDSLPACKLPVLVVHGTADGLFPVQMARELASWCGAHAELRLIPHIGHNQPFYHPTPAYWGPIGAFLLS